MKFTQELSKLFDIADQVKDIINKDFKIRNKKSFYLKKMNVITNGKKYKYKNVLMLSFNVSAKFPIEDLTIDRLGFSIRKTKHHQFKLLNKEYINDDYQTFSCKPKNITPITNDSEVQDYLATGGVRTINRLGVSGDYLICMFLEIPDQVTDKPYIFKVDGRLRTKGYNQEISNVYYEISKLRSLVNNE